MTTLNLQVVASADDAYQDSGGTASVASTGATMGTGTAASSPDRVNGYRFTNVTIAPGSTITSAVPKVKKRTTQFSTVAGTWFGNDVDDAAAFSNGEDMASRTLTTASVACNENVNRVDATYYSWPTSGGDCAAIVQEIIDRPGWASGNSIVLLFIGDSASSFASADVHHYDNLAANAATLDITYDAPVQHARPTSDVSNGGSWTTDSGGTTSLYQSVDESSASDADYVRSPTTPASAVLELGLGSITDPAVSTGHEIRFRAQQTAAGPGYGLTVALYEGATQRATYSPAALTAAWADYSYALTGGEADSITNYADLRLRLTATETPVAPTYVASGAMVSTATSGATMAPQAPTRAVGDILVLVAHTSGNGDFNDTIANWTKLSSGTETNTAAQKVECWWRLADNTASDHPTVGGIADTNVRAARVFAVRGAANQAPTVQRSNNAASATVTFPATSATAAVSLSVLAYAYEDDPTAIGTVSGFSAFNVGSTTTGNDAAIGMNANRANSGSGSQTGGTATVSGGTFANSVNVGLHFIFEPLVGTRAQVSWAEFVAPESAGGTTTLAPGGLANAPAFGTAALTAGAVALAPGGLANTPAQGTSALTSLVTLAPAGLGNTPAMGIPTLTAGAVTLQPAGLANAPLAGQASVTSVVTLAPGGLANAPAFGGATIASVTAIAPSGLANAPAFGGASITSVATLAPSGVANTPGIGSASITSLVTLAPAGLGNAPASGQATITSVKTLTPGGLGNTPGLGTATVTAGGVNIAPGGLGNAPAFGLSTIIMAGGPTTILPDGLANTPATGTATLTAGPVALAPSGLANTPAFGSASITSTKTLTPAGLGNVPAFGTSTLTSGAASIQPSGLANTPGFGTPALTPGAVSIAPAGKANTPAFGGATITSLVTIAPSGAAITQGFDTSALTPGAVAIHPSGLGNQPGFGATVLAGGIIPIETFLAVARPLAFTATARPTSFTATARTTEFEGVDR